MKIDFAMLERLAEAGAPAKAIIEYLRAEDEKRQPKRAKEKGRQRAKRSQPKATPGNNEQQSPTPIETPSQAAERELFLVAKKAMGKRCGGLVSSLLRHHNYDLAAARRVVDVAATKSDPREYVVASMRSKGNGTLTDVADDLISRAKELERKAGFGEPDDEALGGFGKG